MRVDAVKVIMRMVIVREMMVTNRGTNDGENAYW